ncbi:hypothetical protein C8J57DRAFT_1312947 [Mycena rebaudengoi]|nr:hypothetical protein C8J57DRAFT_1312947 [Mycena rebaudengoi]
MGLEYPLTRSFPGKFFTPLVYLGAAILLVFLSTINVALTGYETITVFKSDFNVTQKHWFHNYIPSLAPKLGTLCDSRVFNLGDTFTTNYTLFQYTLASINRANAGDSGVSYKGTTLDDCDITSLFVHGDMNTYSVDYTAVITCRSGDYELTARSDFSVSSLSGKSSQILGVQKSLRNRAEGHFNQTRDARGVVLDAVTSLCSIDVASRIFTLAQASKGTSPVIISLQADFPFCPASLGPVARCASSVPEFNVSSSFVAYANHTFSQYIASDPPAPYNQPVLNDETAGIMANVIQTLYAAVRVDLGNPSPNNILLNASAVPATILSSFPPIPGVYNTSELFSTLVGGTSESLDFNITGLLPLSVPGPGVLDVVYLCRFQEPKAPAQAFIAVLVATLSMFSSGWAVFLVLATRVVKKRDGAANACEEHFNGKAHAQEKQAFI